jgi:hypothetical protein|tara:strand:- start:582 stop:869 length:288 start_codon:yes stop_codon:yes gene_type:complete
MSTSNSYETEHVPNAATIKAILETSKWYHDDKGNISAMRVISVSAAFVGMATLIASTVGVFLKLPTMGIAGIAAGLITTAMGLKWAQKHEEAKVE